MRAHMGQAPCPSWARVLPIFYIVTNIIVNHRLKQVFADRISSEVQTVTLNFDHKVINCILNDVYFLRQTASFRIIAIIAISIQALLQLSRSCPLFCQIRRLSISIFAYKKAHLVFFSEH